MLGRRRNQKLPDRAATGHTRGTSNRRRSYFSWGAAIAVASGLLAGGAASSPAFANSAAIVVDARTGDVLYAYQPDKPLRPASLTKMMTIYMAFEALETGRLRLDQKLTVSRRATWQRPSRLGLRRGRTITVKQAILALVTKSANDVAVVLAETLAGTEQRFAAQMTARARALGMTGTTFRNASGLHHPQQWTTARDMVKLATALIDDYPEDYRYFSTSSFSWKGRRYKNHNALLAEYDGMDGIKTGYTRQSGYNLTASAERDDRRLIGVVLGSRSTALRDWRMKTLLDFGFAGPRDADPADGGAPLPYLDQVTGVEEFEKIIEMSTLMASAADRTAGIAAAASAADTETTVPATTGDSDTGYVWGIQVGAYNSATPAEEATAKAASRVPSLLDDASPKVIPITKGDDHFYRARLVGLSETNAREACRQLSRYNMPCLAIASRSVQ